MNKPEKNLKDRKNKKFTPLKIKNIKFPEEKLKAASWVHVLLWISLGAIVAVSLINNFWPHLLWHHFTLEDHELHSTIEALGAIAAILIAFMPLQVLFGKYKPSFVFLSTGFLVMGLLDLFHSFYKLGHGFVFTHAAALLAGGFFFALFVFPWKINADKAKKYILISSCLVTIILAAIASLNREAFPEMIRDGVFTPAANSINLAAGILFSISAIKLIFIYIQEKNLGVLILVFIAVSSAIVGITFQYSTAWSDSWWLWHTVRLIAFLAVLGYMFWRIQAVSEERNQALDNIKEKHNQLQASEERFSLVNEATKQGLWDWNVPKNEVYFSPVWKMQVGYKDDELENDFANWAKLLHPEDKERCLKAVDDYLKDPEGKFILEFRFQHKDGHYVWIHNQAASVKDKEGNVLRMFGAHTDITAQKEAEEKLEAEKALMDNLMENIPDTIYFKDLENRFIRISNSMVKSLGAKSLDEIIGKTDFDFHSKKIANKFFEEEQNIIKTGKPLLNDITKLETASGKSVWNSTTKMPLLDNNGAVIGTFGFSKDISIIKSNEEKFKSLFENDPSAILIADPQTGLLYDVNPAAEKLMEMSRDELIGLHQSKLHPEEIVEEQVEKFKALQNQPNVSVDSVVLTKTGKRKPVEIKVSIVEIDNQPYILGIFHDISKLIEGQKKLKQNEEKYRTLTESSQDQIFTISKDFKVLYVNNKAAKMFRASPEKLVGKHLKEIFPPQLAEQQIDSISKVLQTEKSSSNVSKSIFPGKTVWLDTMLVPLKNSQGETDAVMGVSRDVSEKKQKEDELILKDIVYKSSVAANSTSDMEGKLTSVNQSFLKTWGYESEEEVLGKPIPDFIKYEKDAQPILEGLTTEGKWQGNYTALKNDGSTFIAQANASVLYNADHEKIGYQSSVIDVTEQKRAEERIKESEQKFRTLFNSVSIPLCHVREDGIIESINNRFKEHLGYTIDEIPTIDDWWKKAYPDEKYREWGMKNWEKAVEKSIKNKTDIESDIYDVTSKNGEVRQIIIAGITMKNDVLATFIDVTEQRKAEKAIIDEKEFSDSVINALPGIFYLFNDQGKYIKWNKMLEELSGFTPEEITERSPLDYFAGYHQEKVADAIQNAFKEGEASVEADLMVKGKTPTPFYFTGRSIVLQGKPHLLGVGMDISQRKKAEKEKETALQKLNDRVKEMTCLFEVNEVIKNPEVSFPEVMQRITRLVPKGWHYPEKTAVEIVLGEETYQSKNFSDSNHFLQENIVIQNKDRGYIKVTVFDLDKEQSKEPFLAEEKELLKTIATNISIYVQRVESEQEIRESEENFRNVYSNSPVSIWQEDWTEIIEMIDNLKKEGVKDFKKYINENRQFVDEALTKVVINDVNQATLTMFEAESKDDLVKSLEVVFATEDTLPGFIGELIALAEGKRIYETEMKLNTAKGNLVNTMLRMSFPSEDVQDGQVLVSIMDITDLKVAQEQLKVLMENLKRSNKELERFAYVASHDLQEPLRMVSSYTQLLERRYKGQLDERADKYIHYAVDGAARMQNLINDLLDFSRISTRGEKFTKTDTNEVLKNTLSNLEARINETGAQIKTGKLPVIKADSGQIERLFLNLIGNALKFSKPDEKPVIEINAKKQKDKWLFTVKDNGIGIDEKFKEKVFVIFQRLHGTTQYKGTGIGLAICKRIVQRHEGEIWFESEENKGTTFYFTLKKHKLDV